MKHFNGKKIEIERVENGFVVEGTWNYDHRRRVCGDVDALVSLVCGVFGSSALLDERNELWAQLGECERQLQKAREIVEFTPKNEKNTVDPRPENGIVIKRVDNGFIVESEQKTSGVPWNRRFCEDFGALIDLLCLVLEKSARSGLRFSDLREANRRRLPEFKDAHGRPAHAEPDGSDWSPNDWYTAASGELGELGNLLKKVRRGDLDLDEAMPDIRYEIADAVCYLDLLANRLDIDLGEAVIEKFNIISERVGSDVRLGE